MSAVAIYLGINPFLFANERTEMKLKIYLSEAWMCSEFGMLLPMSNEKGLLFKCQSAKLEFVFMS